MKNIFIFYLIIFLLSSINAFQDEEKAQNNIKFLNIPFKRNLTLDDSMTPEQFVKTIFYNQIYINMKVGSEKQEIPFYLYLQRYPVVLQTSQAKKGQVKGIYNHSKSSTYKQLGEESTFVNGEVAIGVLSQDKFYFNNTSSDIQFYLNIESNAFTHITEGGSIGFQNFFDNEEDKGSNFVEYLKQLDVISSYYVSILYDSYKFEDDTGKLYIGALPHEINKKQYDEKDLKKIYSKQYFYWEFTIEDLYLGNKSTSIHPDAYFYPEFGFISGIQKFFDILNNTGKWNYYFNISQKCYSFNFRIDDFDNNGLGLFLYEYTAYYCDKDVDINDIFNESIIFSSTDDKIEFNFTMNELWLEKGKYKYFLILNSASNNNIWILGKPFFKKYHLVFNSDSKQIGFYQNVNFDNKNDGSNEKNNTILYVLVIIGLVIIIGVLAFFLIKFYIYSPRKKRANELLDDNYEYTQNENQDNRIIPSEEDKQD